MAATVDGNDGSIAKGNAMKRSLSSDTRDGQTAKRQRTNHHSLRYKQQWHVDPSLTPQDELFFQSQLLRAIVVALSAVGFDSVKPTALEAFRAEVEECMQSHHVAVPHVLTSCRHPAFP